MGIAGVGGAKRGDIGPGRSGAHGWPPSPAAPLRPRPPPHSRCSMMIRKCPGLQAEVDGEIVGIAGTSGEAARVWANRISKV